MLRLRDREWERVREHFPEENREQGRPGRKPVATRRILEAVLWILSTGAQWHMLPQCYPNYKTVHRRFRQWCRDEMLRAILTDMANALREQGEIDESNASPMRALRWRRRRPADWKEQARQRRENMR